MSGSCFSNTGVSGTFMFHVHILFPKVSYVALLKTKNCMVKDECMPNLMGECSTILTLTQMTDFKLFQIQTPCGLIGGIRINHCSPAIVTSAISSGGTKVTACMS